MIIHLIYWVALGTVDSPSTKKEAICKLSIAYAIVVLASPVRDIIFVEKLKHCLGEAKCW